MALPDFALCVGIDSYPGLTPLGGAERDATAFYGWATGPGGVDPAYAKLITSSAFPAGPNVAAARPASAEVWAFFEEIRAAANASNAANQGLVAGRRLYMFFSGHGFSPSIDASGVLMANAEPDTPHNLSAKTWADRFYENGLFEEVLLFQDACREPVIDVELTPPYLKRSLTDGIGQRRRFYAFAARSPLLALEKEIGGEIRGVFSATLMEGLAGGARDPATGAITADGLKRYLVANMAARLTPDELEDDDISSRPEVFNPDDFDIVAAPAMGVGLGSQDAAAAQDVVPLFPVEVALPPPGQGARILDHARQVVRSVGPDVAPWRTELPLGLFELVAPGLGSRLFRVLGAVGADGRSEVIHVG
ncbi:MAG TPA: hypothetical protein VF605_10695 [Allosphingosinicella sp.]|jgi:hypothetical protein